MMNFIVASFGDPWPWKFGFYNNRSNVKRLKKIGRKVKRPTDQKAKSNIWPNNIWPKSKKPNKCRNNGPSHAPRPLWPTISVYLIINCIIFCFWIHFLLHCVFLSMICKIFWRIQSFLSFNLFIFGL